jgi:predicted small lipoprotein YifL
MPASLTALARCLLVAMVLGVSGCGLKGDLYLPEAEPPAAEAPDEEREREDSRS